jgi:hypothetical protein
VWWGLRASADGSAAGYPVVVFGGKHADVPITAEMGGALGRLVAGEALACVVDLSELGSNAARRRFISAFCEAPFTRRMRSRCISCSTRPIFLRRSGRSKAGKACSAISRKSDVLSQADILIAMKLTASQDRAAIGVWIEGQADRQEGKRILGDLPRLQRGEGYLCVFRSNMITFRRIRDHVRPEYAVSMGAGSRHSRSRRLSGDPHLRQFAHTQAWCEPRDTAQTRGGGPHGNRFSSNGS